MLACLYEIAPDHPCDVRTDTVAQFCVHLRTAHQVPAHYWKTFALTVAPALHVSFTQLILPVGKE